MGLVNLPGGRWRSYGERMSNRRAATRVRRRVAAVFGAGCCLAVLAAPAHAAGDSQVGGELLGEPGVHVQREDGAPRLPSGISALSWTVSDARSGKVVKSIGIGAPALDVAVGQDAVWVATGSSGSIVRVDPEIGAVVDRIDLAGPDDIVVPDAAGVTVGDDGMLWVASAEGVLRVDPDREDFSGHRCSQAG